MKRALSLVTLLVTGLATTQSAPVPKVLKNDGELLVGLWKQESISIRGGESVTLPGEIFFQFNAEKQCGMSEKVAVLNATFTIDPAAAPRRMKWTLGDKVWNCVYELDGDRLLFGFLEPGTEPPAKVEPAKNLTLHTLTRIKK
jgi:uncharacterized protein (TIGR03067 family)